MSYVKKKDKQNTFLPIPSLDNLYEINMLGEVRNAKTKNIIQPCYHLKIDGKPTSRALTSLLWEVHGFRPKKYALKNLPVSAKKGKEKYFFQSYAEFAKFLAKRENYTPVSTLYRYLKQKRKEIFGWKIIYDQETPY